MPFDSLTRRRVLAAVGSVSALYLGADRVGATFGDSVDLNQRTVNGTYAQSNEFTDAPPRIGLSWREIVNGQVQNDTGLTADSKGETRGVGLVVDEAVMPGDSGSVTMRAELFEDDSDTPTQNAELYLLLRLSDVSENGVTEPERDAGDSPGADGGELADAIHFTVWIDEGIFTGNGQLEDIPVIGDQPIAEGQLADVVPEDPAGGERVREFQIDIGGETCLSPGDTVYVSFEWSIPVDMGNRIQSDSATFQVAFDPRPCGE